MIRVGNNEFFAIEASITAAYSELGARALGYFVIYIGNRRYGVKAPDASLLACSYDEVARRIENAGTHWAPFASHGASGVIADAVYGAIYGLLDEQYPKFDCSQLELRNIITSGRVMWAPDGDQAFDDGSYVLHFDLGSEVRLIGFMVGENRRHDPSTIHDIRLPSVEFYALLRQWRDGFDSSWRASLGGGQS